MKKCPDCQLDNPAEAVLCNYCGSELSITCPQCGTENNIEARFCQQCGSRLREGDQPGKAAIQEAKKKVKKEAERRQLTILFCDLVGSTSLSERLDPEEFRQVITDYHHVAEKVIKENGGYIAQYLGDGLLTYFGYPEGLEDAPKAGVRTGLGIIEAMAEANKNWEVDGKTPVDVRIGIHTGLVVVDEHLALGKTVNIAARLEGLAPHNGVVISPQTMKLVYGWFELKSIGKHSLKGISEPLEVFHVLHESEAVTRLDVAKSRGLSPLVGRKNELNILNEYWKQAKKGKSHLVLLYGEAGIGKSRLVDTLEKQISQEPESMMALALSSAYQKNTAFHPIIGMLEKYIFKFEADGSSEEKIVKLERTLTDSSLENEAEIPMFAEFLSIPSGKYPPLIMSPFAKRQRTMNCLTRLLLDLAHRQPLLFILEDLHWADASTLEWLKQFIEQKVEGNILTLCTTRPGFKADWQGHSGVTQINLQRLLGKDIKNICHHQTKGKSLPGEILDQIYSKTEGVPLFVEELTKTIIESDILVEKEDYFEVSGGITSIAIPSTLQDSLLARLDRLGEVKEIVQVGSVLGREFSVDMLNAVIPEQANELEHSLSRLMESEIIYHDETSQQNVYQFKHALIQDAAYESLLKSRRQQMHHKVASVLEEQFKEVSDTQPELLAHHYTEAGEPLQAIPLCLKAGQLASQKNAAAEAIAHLEKGLGLLHHIKAEKDRMNVEFDFLLVMGHSYIMSLGYPHPKVKETFNRAKDLALNMEGNPKLAAVFLGLATYYFNTEDYKLGGDLMDNMMELAKDPENRYFFALPAFIIRGASNVIQGDLIQAEKNLRKGNEIYDPSQTEFDRSANVNLKVNGEAWLSVALQVLGKMDEAKTISENHLKMVKDYTGSHNLYHLYTFPALRALLARDWKYAVVVLEKYLPIVREFGDPVFTLTAEVYYNIALAFQGDEKAFKTAVHLINVCFDIGFKAFASTLSPFIPEIYFQNGDNQSALNWIDRILEHAKQTGSYGRVAELYRLKGLALGAQGKSDDIVEEYLMKALDLARKQSAKTYELRAAVDLALLRRKQGKAIEGYELLKKIYNEFTEGHDFPDLKNARQTLVKLKK